MKLQLELLGQPFAKQSFRFAQVKTKAGKILIMKYQPKKIRDSEANLRTQIINQLPKDFIPFSKAVMVEFIDFRFAPIKSLKKEALERIENGLVFAKLTKPDLMDNLMKGLFDAMKGVVMTDDSIVWSVGKTRKYYSKKPGISIMMEGE